MIYVGIDNGLTGGICILDGSKLSLHVMPVLSDGKKKRVDVLAFDRILQSYLHNVSDHFIVYERPIGSQGVNPAVSMADSFARIESVMILRGYRREPVTPQRWQKMFWSKPKMPTGVKFNTKVAALNKAKQLWPDQDWRKNNKCRIAHDGLVDSFLITEYARRTY